MVDTLKVAMLGLSGSGKTTYLASMFRKLSVQSKDVGFKIDCDDDLRRRELNELYRLLLIPDAEIPKTQIADKMIIRPFTFYVTNGANTFPGLRIEYADYAGELLNVPTVDNKDFINYLEKADVVLAMISGKKIYEYLTKGAVADLDDEITNTVQLLEKYASKNPVHFIISMWDLFEDSDAELQKIKNNLLDFELFKVFTERMQANGSRIRLIPVSSYGFNFAELREGQMCKISGGKPNPVKVELPLVCTFRDSFEHKLKQARKDLEQKLKMPEPKVEEKFNVGDFFKDLLGSVAKTGIGVVRFVLPKSFEHLSDNYLKTLIGRLDQSEKRRKIRRVEEMNAEYERLLQEQQAAIKLVTSEKTALESVLRSCDKIILGLEQQLPSSVI